MNPIYLAKFYNFKKRLSCKPEKSKEVSFRFPQDSFASWLGTDTFADLERPSRSLRTPRSSHARQSPGIRHAGVHQTRQEPHAAVMERELPNERAAHSTMPQGCLTVPEESCPVCFEKVTERSFFACGHFVCATCNATLLQRGFLACPTCRTPRAGVSQEAVENANHNRSLENLAEENPFAAVAAAFLFFPSEGPFTVSGNSVRPLRTTRTRWSWPPYHTRRAAASTTQERAAHSTIPNDPQGNQEESQGNQTDTGGAPMELDPVMARLVAGLLGPTDLQDFLARRRDV